jgi:hypothetical protein
VGKPFADPSVQVAHVVKRAVDHFKEHMLEAVSKKTAALERRINKFKLFALKSMKHLQGLIDE